jgi:quercetin dioxygenase-like cupin family protein
VDENEFRLKAKEEGYSEPEVHEVEHAPAKEMHTHDHSVLSLVLSGQFTMFYEHGATTYGPGDWCENPRGTLHTEQIGTDGVVALVAKK